MTTKVTNHQPPGGGAAPARPLTDVAPTRQATPGEEVRSLLAGATTAALATLDEGGHPFGSVAPFGIVADGTPVLCISGMAEHTYNLDRDPRASLLVVEAPRPGDPLALGRVTLVGTVELVSEAGRDEARAAYLAANPGGIGYVDFGDFTFRRLVVERIRWVGGFGRMAWCTVEDYNAAEADPTRPVAASAVAHLNTDHAAAVLAIARVFTGHPDATAAVVDRLDRYGLDLVVDTPRGQAMGRAAFVKPVAHVDELRAASVELTRRARKLA